MGKLFYFVKEALRGFLQAKLMTFVSIVTIAVALFVVGIVLVAFLSVHHWMVTALEDPGLVVYIEDAVSGDSARCASLSGRIREFPQVVGAVMVSKDTAWSRFETLYGPEMLDAVDVNPFPASLEVSLVTQSQSPEAAAELKREILQLDGVEGVYYSREWIAVLNKLRTWFTAGALLVGPFLFLALHSLIANTIKLTIYARRDLVTNMRFVGATDFYIKMPFVLEGMLQGMVGGAAAVLGLVVLRFALASFSLQWGLRIGTLWLGPSYLFLLIFVVGVTFGWIGSMSAVRKFLQ